jgi:hypothetical protein
MWISRSIAEGLDRQGNADFAAGEIQSLVDGAVGSGAAIERLVVEYDGAGGKKVTHTELDCWQQSG